MDVLSGDLCKKVFTDFVEKPFISLYHIVNYELYKLCLFHTMLPCQFGSRQQILDWLCEDNTFNLFKTFVITVVKTDDINICIDGITREEWNIHVADNESVVKVLEDWARGGGFEIHYQWKSFKM